MASNSPSSQQCSNPHSIDSSTDSPLLDNVQASASSVYHTAAMPVAVRHHHHHDSHRHPSKRSSSSHQHRQPHSSSSNSATSSLTPPPTIIRASTGWFQRKINLRPALRGCHLVTDEIVKQIPEISNFQVGVCNVHIMHTSASLTLNENWDPDVREDMELFLTNFIPENLQFRHGPHEDMPAHVKSCFLGSSLTIPITEGQLSLGVWQGVWLCEHRDNAGSRKLMVTINGALKF